MVFSETWIDTFEDVPADGDQIKFGAGKIRDLKEAIRERMQVDHEFAEADGSGTDTGTDSGYHKKVTLLKTSIVEPDAGYSALAAEGTKLKYFPEGDAEREIVDLNQTQTLTNKTLTSPNIAGGILTDNFDCDNYNFTNVDINSGSIDGVPVGSASAATGAFTTLAASGLATLAVGIVVGGGTLKYKVFSSNYTSDAFGNVLLTHGAGAGARAAFGFYYSGGGYYSASVNWVNGTSVAFKDLPASTSLAMYVIVFYI